MHAVDSISCEMLGFTLKTLSITGLQGRYSGDEPIPILEIVLDGNLVHETNASNNPSAPSWDCNLTFTARSDTLIFVGVIDTASKCIGPDGMLTRGERVVSVTVRARDLRDAGALARLPLYCGRRKFPGTMSIALAIEKSEVQRPVPTAQLPIPTDMYWEDYFEIERDMAWRRWSEWLAYQGYEVCINWVKPDGGYTPMRPRLSTIGAKNPFQPQSDEEFVHQSGKLADYPTKWLNHNSRVRHAYDSNGRLIVLKLVPNTDCANEASIMQFLNSAELRSHNDNHCLPVIDVLETGMGFSVLVLPCWDERNGNLFGWQVDDYFEKAIQAFEGLAFMHEHRVFHRDISPGNITSNHLGDWDATPVPFPNITTYNYVLGFFDFELASRFPADTPLGHCTAEDIRGTRGLMAPEVSACGKKPASYELGPADVYALGSTLLYELQYEGDRTMSRYQSRRGEYHGIYAWRVVTELIPGFVGLLRDAMTAEPSLRPSAADMVTRLCALRESIPLELRFAPQDGYTDYTLLMARSIQARLI